MKRNKHKVLLRKLLLQHRGNNRLWPALLAICLGTILLLFAVMLWTGFRDLLNGSYDNDALGSSYLIVSKRVVQEEALKEQKIERFNISEIRALSGLPQVADIAMLSSNRFPVSISLKGSGEMDFTAELFLEAVPDRFIDDKPIDWYWQHGSPEVPVILSTELLNLYNFGFAISQGLPQLSRNSLNSMVFNMRIGSGTYSELFSARVVGFSDRINSILVPESFIEFGNKMYAPPVSPGPTRVIIKVKDPSDKSFIQYLADRDYMTNTEALRSGKLRTAVQVVSMATGLLAVLLLIMGVLIFLLFIELAITRARESLQLLITIGYSPRFLSTFMFMRFFPLLLFVMVVAGILAMMAQVKAAKYILNMHLYISKYPAWEVWTVLGSVTLLILLLVSRAIVRAVK